MRLITFEYKKEDGSVTQPIVFIHNEFTCAPEGTMIDRIMGYDLNKISPNVLNSNVGTCILLQNFEYTKSMMDFEWVTTVEKLIVQEVLDSCRQYKFERMSKIKTLHKYE